MQIEIPCPELRLLSNQPLRLRNARGLVIACKAGIVWITVGGQIDDIFLKPGERYVIASKNLTLVEAIGVAEINIQPATQRRHLKLGIPAMPHRLPSGCPA